MKAAFILMQGALVEGHAARFALRKRASDGLRRLAELDFRLIVLDHASTAGRACTPAALHGTPAQCDPRGWLHHQQTEAGPRPSALAAQHLQRRHSDATAHPRERSSREASQRISREASQHSSRDTGRRDRLINLLLREQLPLQDYYGCAQGASDGVWKAHPASAIPLERGEPGHAPGAVGSHHGGHDSDQDSGHESGHESGDESGHPNAGYQARGYGSEGASGARMPGVRQKRLNDAAAPVHRGFAPGLPPQALLVQLLRAAVDHRIDLRGSWLLGADLDAIEAGHRAGCRTVLIDNGTETVWHLGRGRMPTRIAPDLQAAAILIIEEGQRIRMF